MRQKLNENPMVQIAVIVVLAIGVALLLITRMGGSSEPAPATTSTAATTPGATAAPATPAPGAIAPAPGTTAPPATGTVTPGATAPPAGGTVTNDFTAGPGLPKPVVTAYDSNRAVVLLVLRRRGIADQDLARAAQILRARPDVALFVTGAGKIADYSRITEGVDVNQLPALVVVQPKNISDQPTATVAYGFRGPQSVVQSVDDALYKGKQIPYYPR